jgi:hypothetical protein
MGAAILELTQPIGNPLHEHRSPAEHVAEPVIFPPEVRGEAEQPPEPAKPSLFGSEGFGVVQRARIGRGPHDRGIGMVRRW